MPWDRTAGVIGPQGSGKTLDLLTPALLAAPGPALVTLTKVTDLLLSLTARGTGGRPVLVLDRGDRGVADLRGRLRHWHSGAHQTLHGNQPIDVGGCVAAVGALTAG